jgi:hypothetical protein
MYLEIAALVLIQRPVCAVSRNVGQPVSVNNRKVIYWRIKFITAPQVIRGYHALPFTSTPTAVRPSVEEKHRPVESLFRSPLRTQAYASRLSRLVTSPAN